MLHILARFRERYPGIAMVVSAGNSEEVIAQLYDYEAEVGILGEVPESRDFVVIKLSSTPLIAFTSRAHALSRRRSITLAELAAQMLVLRERGSKRSEEHTSELQSLMRISYAVFCLKTKRNY